MNLLRKLFGNKDDDGGAGPPSAKPAEKLREGDGFVPAGRLAESLTYSLERTSHFKPPSENLKMTFLSSSSKALVLGV
jgi:hypothetical protein